MKLSTATIYGMIWLLPSLVAGQTISDNLNEINIEEQSDTTVEFYKRKWLGAESEEAAMSLELVRLRLLIGEEEAKGAKNLEPKKNDRDELVLERLKFKENELSQKLDFHRDYTSLLEQIIYWPATECERVLNDFFGKVAERSAPSEKLTANEQSHPTEKKVYQPFLPKFDLMEYPPKAVCYLEKSEGTINDGIGRIHTTPQILFSHTDQRLESHFPKRDFITGYASLVSAKGGVKMLDLVVAVGSPKAKTIWGTLRQRGFIVVKLLDGTEVRLQSQMPSTGEWDVLTQSYIYHCRYLIGSREERLLSTKEVDEVFIQWSKAQDGFEIYELDFFINHFACLGSG